MSKVAVMQDHYDIVIDRVNAVEHIFPVRCTGIVRRPDIAEIDFLRRCDLGSFLEIDVAIEK